MRLFSDDVLTIWKILKTTKIFFLKKIGLLLFWEL